MGKWAGFVIEHGIAGVAALLLALAAVWWVDPTTEGGMAFLLVLVFVVTFAAIELTRRALARRREGIAKAAATNEPEAPTEGEPAAERETPSGR